MKLSKAARQARKRAREVSGKNLKSLREAAGFSQAKLAELMNVSPGTVAGWELGSHNPSIEKLPALAKVLGTTAARIVEAA